MTKIELRDYDYYIIGFSGGKDSTACYLYLLEQGIKPNQIEIWHHDVDGREGSKLMDWPITHDYCRAFADHFGSPIYYSWKVGGFEREMTRENDLTAPTKFETPKGNIIQIGGTRGKPGTRLKFPQVSGDLSVRWCSAYLKIDIGSASLRNQARFNNSRTLMITGERAEESPKRAKYLEFEIDRADKRQSPRLNRHVDRWRPVLHWSEQEVWDIIQRHKVKVHPAYYMGWGRVSCAACIFGSANQWASLYQINPEQVERISDYEEIFRYTIKRKQTVIETVLKGTPYPNITKELASLACSENYDIDITVENWELPAGAFGESCGPT